MHYNLDIATNNKLNSAISSTTTTNCIDLWPYYTYPTIVYPNYNYYQIAAPVKYDIQLQKVENGWILHKEGKQYVITDENEVIQYLKR